MIVDSFAKLYSLFNDMEDNGAKASLSTMLLNNLGLRIATEPLPVRYQQSTAEVLQVLASAFNESEQMQQNPGGVCVDFHTFDLFSASYAVSSCFDARVSHHPSSCDYFILFEQLRNSAQVLGECAYLSKTLDEAARDITLFDELFALPTLRLAMSYVKPSLEKDVLILADLMLLFFRKFSDFSIYYQSSSTYSSAAMIVNTVQPTDDKIRKIIAFKVYKLAEETQGIHALQQMLIKLSAIRHALHDNLAALSLKTHDNRLTVEKIIAGKSAIAYGYHHNKKLNHCPFDDLMKDDPQAFTHHLKKSAWFTGRNPEKLPFFSKLTAFEGPMYKVFTEKELAVIKQWALSKSPEKNCTADDTTNSSLFPSLTLPRCEEKYRQEINIRPLFYQLMTSDDHYYLDWQSEKFTDAWLARARKKIRQIPFKDYSDALLNEWFLRQTKMQIDDYAQGHIVSEKSKQEVIDEALHLAPMILLDGAWINHYSHPNLINDDIGAFLFEIYADEIGNGHLEKNHPVIYRDLISDMGFELPDIASAEFSSSELFDDDDFLVPVFWLSISRFPNKYLPESLGLNLAMELSGVGGAYNQARDELKQYGFNSLFVDLHNSIDNAASGHSAGALSAIKIYMNRYASKNNPKLTQLLWERVWTGYLSLSPSKKSFLSPLISDGYYI